MSQRVGWEMGKMLSYVETIASLDTYESFMDVLNVFTTSRNLNRRS